MLPRNILIALDLQILACRSMKLDMLYMARRYLDGMDLMKSAAAANASVIVYESAQAVIDEGLSMFASIEAAMSTMGPERGLGFARLMDNVMETKHSEANTAVSVEEIPAILLGPIGSTSERAFEDFLQAVTTGGRAGDA